MRGRATLSDPQRQNGGLLMAILTERAHNAAQPALHHTSGPPCPVQPPQWSRRSCLATTWCHDQARVPPLPARQTNHGFVIGFFDQRCRGSAVIWW